MSDPKEKMERKIAIGLPVFIRDGESWIYFGKYTRWLEWREDLGRYRTVWTKLGWEPEGTPAPEKWKVQINRTPGKMHIKVEE